MVGWRNAMLRREKDESSVGGRAKNKTDKETRRKDCSTRELKKLMGQPVGGGGSGKGGIETGESPRRRNTQPEKRS